MHAGAQGGARWVAICRPMRQIGAPRESLYDAHYVEECLRRTGSMTGPAHS